MFGRLMNNYYYGKSGKGDFRKEDLPENRWQLFWDTLRTRLSALFRLNMMYMVIWLPTMIVLLTTYITSLSNLNTIVSAKEGTLQQEVQETAGQENAITFTDEEIARILKTLSESTEETYGAILRSKGMVPRQDGTWIHFDMVPEETQIRTGAADYTGRIVVIGAGLKEDKIQELFGL